MSHQKSSQNISSWRLTYHRLSGAITEGPRILCSVTSVQGGQNRPEWERVLERIGELTHRKPLTGQWADWGSCLHSATTE